MAEEFACCAHLTVRWRTQLLPQGTTTGWWECTDCHLPFAPTAVADGYATRIDNQRKEIERLRDSLRAVSDHDHTGPCDRICTGMLRDLAREALRGAVETTCDHDYVWREAFRYECDKCGEISRDGVAEETSEQWSEPK